MKKAIHKWLIVALAMISTVCLALGLVACKDDKSPADDKLTYIVSVSAPADVSLTGIKAQWLKDTTAASEEVALNIAGVASVELEKGDYTVTLKNVPAGYTFEEKNVTAASPNALIVITESVETATYTLTVTTETDLDLSTLTAKWLTEYDGDEVGSVALDQNGHASVELAKGEYYVTLEGVPAVGYSFWGTTASEEEPDAEIEIYSVETATYTVSVTTETDLDLSTLTAQWEYLYGGTVAASKALDENGEASILLNAEYYTVTLLGVPVGYEFGEDVVVDDTDPDASFTITEAAPATYSVTVTILPEDADFALTDLTAQWKKGGRVVASEKLSANGTASVELNAGSYTVTLDGVPQYYAFTEAYVTADDPDAQIEIDDNPMYATYTVTVTAPEAIDLTTITAVWKQWGYVQGSQKLSADGTASIKLIKGDYEVTLNGVNEDVYTFASAFLEELEEEYDATIVITELQVVTYLITVEHDSYSGTYSDLQVQLSKNGELVGEPKTVGETWEVEFEIMAGDYEVVVSGLGEDYTYMIAELLTKNNQSTTLIIGLAADSGNGSDDTPYELSAEGYYILTGGTDNEGTGYSPARVYVRFTAPETGTYSFDLTDNTYEAHFFTTAGRLKINSDETIVVYELEEGDTAEFDLTPTKGDYDYAYSENELIPFSLNVTAGDALYDPDEGKTLEKAKDAVEGINAIEGVTEGWFRLPLRLFGTTHKITLGSDWSAEFYESASETSPVSISAGSTDYEIESGMFDNSYLKVISSGENQVKFVLTIEGGNSGEGGAGTADNPTPLTKDETAYFTFNGWDEAWFTFTPEEAGDYQITLGANAQNATIYLGVDSMGWGEDEVGNTYSETRFTLTQGTKYYIMVSPNSEGAACSITVEDFVATSGSKYLPIEISEGTFTLNTTSYGEGCYYVYTASGQGTISLTASASETYYFTFFADARFDPDNGLLASNNFWGTYEDDPWTYEVNAGDKIYFQIESGAFGAANLSFTITLS